MNKQSKQNLKRFARWFINKVGLDVTLAELQQTGTVDLRALPHVLPRILKLSGRHRARLTLAIISTLGATIVTLVIPHLLGVAVDQAHTLLSVGAGSYANARHALWVTAAFLIAAATGRGLLTMISSYQCEWIGQKIAYDLRLAFFEKLQRLSFEYHDSVHSGDLITRGMLDLEGMRMFIENGVQKALTLGLLLVVGAYLMFRTDPVLAALAFSFVPFVSWRAVRTGLFLRLTWTRLQQRMSILTRTIEENLQGVRVVRAFAAEPYELDKFDESANDALEMSNHRIVVRTRAVSSMTFAFYLAMGLVLWIGGHRVIQGRISVGHLTQFLTFMTILQMPVRQIIMIINTAARAVASGSRLFEILDREPSIRDGRDASDLSITNGVLKFEGVGFAYENSHGVALSDVTFELRPGRVLGIVGAPGSGKSTLVHLIPRFYDVTEGRVTIDGHDIRDVTLKSLRSAVSLVPQDVFLFASSIGDNISYADPAAEGPHLIESSSIADIHNYVESLPQNYATILGERGVGLSGGQRQRMSIARSLVPRPTFLIFDDATSAIDAATEQHVRDALQKFTDRQAVVIVSHRIGSLRHADEILVLDDGRIIERGTHRSLLAANGRYATLYNMQSEAAADAQSASAIYEREAS
ncbi:MAG: ABC transporter ATP-binding protein [Methylovirgula sp.]|uniref:ABC transporter ATP-binding protein n=1 Tax=Methylovirgula sp. TaxID=1978224 RepID=UPI0030761237